MPANQKSHECASEKFENGDDSEHQLLLRQLLSTVAVNPSSSIPRNKNKLTQCK